MNLSHFSEKPLGPLVDKPQDREWFKPKGFWISVDGEHDWPTWCEAESFLDINDHHHYRVHLSPFANILHLKTVEEIREFHDKYTPKKTGYRVSPDWAQVSTEYDGLIISPYQWGLRLDLDVHWYYSWDVASGCIWNSAAIESVELIREPVKEAA